MLKSNLLKACLLAPAIIFCLSLNGIYAELCQPPDCPPNMPTLQDTVNYKDSWRFRWDPNNPNTMGRQTQVTLRVRGGKPPYRWSVSGRGFRLAYSRSKGMSNILYANNSACGSAFITVSDFQDVVKGSVRVPTHGSWRLKGYYCGLPGPGPSAMGWITYIRGGKKQRQRSYNNCEWWLGIPGSTIAQVDDWIVSNCPSRPNCISTNKWVPGPGPCQDAGWLWSTNHPPTPDCNSRIGFIVGELMYYEWKCGQ